MSTGDEQQTRAEAILQVEALRQVLASEPQEVDSMWLFRVVIYGLIGGLSSTVERFFPGMGWIAQLFEVGLLLYLVFMVMRQGWKRPKPSLTQRLLHPIQRATNRIGIETGGALLLVTFAAFFSENESMYVVLKGLTFGVLLLIQGSVRISGWLLVVGAAASILWNAIPAEQVGLPFAVIAFLATYLPQQSKGSTNPTPAAPHVTPTPTF